MNQQNNVLHTGNLDCKYILNPCYILRTDINRVIFTQTGNPHYHKLGNNNFTSFIHPTHAIMLTFFNGDKTLNEALLEVSQFFDISRDTALNILIKFIENKDRLVVEYDDNLFYFPQKVLIRHDNNYPVRTYSVDDFYIDGELCFSTQRFNIPIEANLLINNRCLTDCIYCYADKRQIHDCTIPFERLKEIIKEAKMLGFRNFDIQGGELFLYEYWYELLQELIKAEFFVELSTKVPLQKKQIKSLLDLNYKKIQISLDSIFSEDLETNLRVNKSYCERMINSITDLDQAGFAIKLKPVITGRIFNISKLKSYIDFFKQYKNIKTIEITAPGHSFFKSQDDFFSYRLSLDQIDQIKKLVSKEKESCNFELRADVNGEENLAVLALSEKTDKWNKRAVCLGNLSSFLILPNGDITFCEEAYFNKKLVLGNILNNSIMEVWGSSMAKNMFYTPKDIFPKESACSRCTEFEDCRHTGGICWVDIVGHYGDENFLFPDPRCPLAPPVSLITYYS